MRQAYYPGSALTAEAAFKQPARELAEPHPAAPASLREGRIETLIIPRLGVSPTLVRSLRSTNPIEPMIEKGICRDRPGDSPLPASAQVGRSPTLYGQV